MDEEGFFLEGGLLGTKTSKSKDKRNRFLRLVVPEVGLTKLDWWAAFVEARHALGLGHIPTKADAAARPADEDPPPILPTTRRVLGRTKTAPTKSRRHWWRPWTGSDSRTRAMWRHTAWKRLG